MKHFTLIHPRHLGRHRPLLLALLGVLTISSLAFGADFRPNDEVRLTRDTPLLFLDKPIRQGTIGESFQVLAYQPEQKKVFLAAKDQAGKAIAVSVAEDSVGLVPAEKTKVQADVLAAVSRQQYTIAKNLLDQALRASPDDVDLHSLSIALETVIHRAMELNQTTANQKTVEADLQRLRHNADVTDHANPLDTRDNSGRQRATQMRDEANKVEAQSKQALRTAQADYEAASSALRTIIQQLTTHRMISPSTVRSQEPDIILSNKTDLHQQETLSPVGHPDQHRSAVKTGNDFSEPLYDELRMPEAIRVYPAIAGNGDSLSRYVFFYKQHRQQEPGYFDAPNWPSLLAQEVKDWDNLSFVNLRPIRTPKFTDYAEQQTDGILSDHPVIFLQAIGQLGNKTDDEILKLLSEINGSAQALQVSPMALAEYMGAWQKIYSQNGYEKGLSNARILLHGFTAAAAEWKSAKLRESLI